MSLNFSSTSPSAVTISERAGITACESNCPLLWCRGVLIRCRRLCTDTADYWKRVRGKRPILFIALASHEVRIDMLHSIMYG